MSNRIDRIKKGNLWYPPTKSLYVFLDKIEQSGLPKTLAVLGCADGNYVVPAVKRGFKVLAIDIDEIALYGGDTFINNKKVKIIGMEKKLERLGLEKMVTIIKGSYLEYKTNLTYSGVIASESTHYEANSKYAPEEIMDIIKNYVSIEGLLLFEHIHYSQRNNDSKLYLTSGKLKSFFRLPCWKINSSKKKTYLEEPNIRKDKIHEIILGRLHAQRMR